MSNLTCLKDITRTDLEKLEKVAEAQGWDEIRDDVISEQQTRML